MGQEEESKQKLVCLAFNMLLEDENKNAGSKQSNKKALIQKKITWSYFEKYGEVIGAVFIITTNKGNFLFKVGNGNISYTPI